MNKKQLHLFNNYLKSNNYSLDNVYRTYSREKFIAYEYILRECDEKNGFDVRICSANTFQFTMAYRYKQDNKMRLRYHTRENVYDFEIEY